MYDAGNALKIVEALKDTEAESEANRQLSARAVDLLHQSGVTRIVRLWRLRTAGPGPGGSRAHVLTAFPRERSGCGNRLWYQRNSAARR